MVRMHSSDVDYAAINALQPQAESDPFTRERYRQMEKFLPAGATAILDIGCADGTGGRTLKSIRPTLEIIGLDCMESRVSRLPQDAYVRSICALSTAIDAPDASFDAIVAGEFIEHLTYRDVLTTLDECRRVLHPHGTLVMTTPYPNYLRNLIRDRTTAVGAHLSAHYPKQLAVMMRDAGFGDVRWRGSGRMTRFIGERVPALACYGSFIIAGTRHD